MHSMILLAFLLLCALHDIRTMRIPNNLLFGAGTVALVYLATTGSSWLGAPASAAFAALVLALLLTLPGYLTGKLGAGDVKLLVLIALASDSRHLLLTLTLAGLAYLAWALLSRCLWPRLSDTSRYQLRNLAPDRFRRYPFAPFLLVGVVMSML